MLIDFPNKETEYSKYWPERKKFLDNIIKKIKKQKGTGTARAGSIKSPLFKGGGQIFGPEPREYRLKVNKKVNLKQIFGHCDLGLIYGKPISRGGSAAFEWHGLAGP
mgnify:CR=1 FL=1